MPIAWQPKSSASRTAATYILHCLWICSSVRSVGMIRSGEELACRAIPSTGARPRASSSRGLRRFVVQGRLAEPFLEDAGGMQQVVGDDRVEHAHATLVEHAHDRFLAAKLRGQCSRQAAVRLPGTFMLAQALDVVGLVLDRALGQPAPQAAHEELVGEILAPQSRILAARLGQRAVEVEHADQSRPGARPVGHGQHGPTMAKQPGQHVMRILPDGLGHDQPGLGIEAARRSACLLSASR